MVDTLVFYQQLHIFDLLFDRMESAVIGTIARFHKRTIITVMYGTMGSRYLRTAVSVEDSGNPVGAYQIICISYSILPLELNIIQIESSPV